MRSIFGPPAPAIVHQEDARADQVKQQIRSLQGNLKDHTFDLAELLAEVMQNSYHVMWGHSSFAAWLESSELDVKQRQADHLIKINQNSKELGITRERLRLVKITKLKAIFSLAPKYFKGLTDAERFEGYKSAVLDLVARAVNMSLEEVEAEVRALKGITDEEETTWLNLKVTRKAKDETIMPAIADVKTEAGAEMSDGEAVELICADRMAGNSAADSSYDDPETWRGIADDDSSS